ncbi:MAG: hypothetical protein AB7G48_18660 [Nitrospiraceae bacterium]
MNLNLALILAIALSVGGCTSTIHKTFTIDNRPAGSVSLDAKQRVILVTDKGGPRHDERIVCAEPSPDAVVGITASATAKAMAPNQPVAELSGSMTEALAQLGQRTQMIQLLRDGLYRVCEAYMNGLVDKELYEEVIYMYDDFVVTIVALEALAKQSPSSSVSTDKTDAKTNSTTDRTIKEVIDTYLDHQKWLFKLYYEKERQRK